MTNSIIINQALDALKASLPADCIISTTADGDDTIVKIMNMDFLCLVKESITKTTLNPTLATMQVMKGNKQQVLLITQYINPQLSAELTSKGINHLDCVGNCLIRYTKKGSLIFQISNQG